MPEDRAARGRSRTRPPVRRRIPAVLAAAAVVAFAGPGLACIPGGAVRCAPQGGLAPLPPLTRTDIDALTGLPGPAVTEAVRRDTARTFEAIRRQSLPPAIAYPPDPAHKTRKGDAP